jgi:putative addiction module killer protein
MGICRRDIRIFQNRRGREPFTEWVQSLSRQYRARVFARLDRVETGNFGDCKSVGDGVFELRLPFGAGYRIYFGEVSTTIVLLLCGGDKSSQKKDVVKAKVYWNIYQTEHNV